MAFKITQSLFPNMKKLAYCLLVLLFANKIQAQENKFSINTNLLNLVAKGPSLSAEYRFSKKWIFQVYAASGTLNTFNSYRYNTLIFDFKYAFADNFYTSPYIRYIEKNIYREGIVDNTGFFSFPGRDFKGNGVSIGQTIGMKTLSSKRFNLDTFVGVGYGGFVSQLGDKNGPGFFDIRVGVMTGINF